MASLPLPPPRLRPQMQKRSMLSLCSQLPDQLEQAQSRHFHLLPSGLKMEVISQKASLKSSGSAIVKPPLVFVHGSFHAAWCWAPHWLPFFSECGYDCYALSLLGQGESDTPTGKVAGTLETHALDIADFIRKELERPPVLIGHSFGGLIVQSYIPKMVNQSNSEDEGKHPSLSGAVLICSVPPSGNGGLVWRYLLSKPLAAYKVTMSLAAKGFANSLSLCKETFFSAGVEDSIVKTYQELMKKCSRLPLFDLRKLNASLPPPSVPKDLIPILVLGASDDFIVDSESLNETGKFYGVSPVCIEGIAHDMMLDLSWERGARFLQSWLENLSHQTVSDQLAMKRDA